MVVPVRTVWLLGDAPGSGLDLLAEALLARGCKVERVGDESTRAWLNQVKADVQPSSLPSLLVVSDSLAWGDGGALLESLDQHQPWCFLPLVVVAREENPERCERSYALGAAGWVVLPRALGAARETAEVFARYWLSTNLLPEIGPHARL